MPSSPTPLCVSVRTVLTLAVVGLLLASPLIASEPSPPDPAIPPGEQSSNRTPIGATDASTTVLSLDQLVGIALEHNTTIEAARQRLKQSEGELTRARSAYLPRVEVGGEYNYVHRKDTDTLLTGEDGAIATTATNSDAIVNDDVLLGFARISQLLYDFGRTGGAVGVQRANREAADAFLRRQTNAAILQVKKEYYNVLEKMRLIEIAREAVATFGQHLERTRSYLQAGVRTRVDVINAEVEHANARLNLSRAEYNLKIARAALDQALGTKPARGSYTLKDQAVATDTLLASLPPVAEDVDTLITQAETHRPDLKQIDRLIESAQANLKRARGDYFPSITANARYNDYQTGLSLYQDNMEAGVAVTWELFSGFRTDGEAAAAQAKLLEYRAQLQELRLTVVREVTESWLRTAENRESIAIALQTMDLARQNLVLAEKRYETGTSDVLEFNEARRALTRAQNELTVSYYGYLSSLAALEYAVGT